MELRIAPTQLGNLISIKALRVQVEKEGAELDISQLSAAAWSLEPKSVESLLTRIRKGRRTLKEVTGIAPLYGIKTGFSDVLHGGSTAHRRTDDCDPQGR